MSSKADAVFALILTRSDNFELQLARSAPTLFSMATIDLIIRCPWIETDSWTILFA